MRRQHLSINVIKVGFIYADGGGLFRSSRHTGNLVSQRLIPLFNQQGLRLVKGLRRRAHNARDVAVQRAHLVVERTAQQQLAILAQLVSLLNKVTLQLVGVLVQLREAVNLKRMIRTRIRMTLGRKLEITIHSNLV